MQQIAQQIHSHINSSKKVLIVPHQNPDGDALGSAGAMLEYLKNLGKPAHIYCATPPAARWGFIPHTHLVSQNENHFIDPQIDIIIILDSGDTNYAGVAEKIHGHRATIINIDHHATNKKFGHHNLVDTAASATSEILYFYFKHNGVAINPAMATALLAGIITDTGYFTNSATTDSALFVASDLMRLGADLTVIVKETIRNKTLPSLKLWGEALARLTWNEQSDITYTYLTQTDFIKHDADESEGEGIANFLNNLSGGKIMMILRETADGQVKGSLRTTRDDTDVSVIAVKLGGGGHKKAAGFTIGGTIEEVLNKILQN